MTSERDKMAAGAWYNCVDPELDELRERARKAVHAHNHAEPVARPQAGAALQALLGEFGTGAMIEAPFHCAYGFNLYLGQGVYINAGCTILDTAEVRIGAGTMLGPGVHVYCAEHHKDPQLRAEGLECALPVTLGRNVWVGGRAIILAGVSIGDDAIVAAGALVTRDVPAGARVIGSPARVV
ncbi:sugar O-acetyltransferase [Algicella marina]|uniref:Sugar O-acetyltransferase n=1 Tax=Algicella marina TaxID=2683284 RepID=A0A6P1SZQ1_9RHOB|nr:sugar O-acetyltransferase [Algicella marina]QHQ33722.1 sugar O-acetyltransferase [Algicella marina]